MMTHFFLSHFQSDTQLIRLHSIPFTPFVNEVIGTLKENDSNPNANSSSLNVIETAGEQSLSLKQDVTFDEEADNLIVS